MGVVVLKDDGHATKVQGYQPKAGDENYIFNSFVTGSGSDRIVGNSEVSEIFNAGDGYNQISAGDSENTVDWVDYRNYSAGSEDGLGNNAAEVLEVTPSNNAAQALQTVSFAEKLQNGSHYSSVDIFISGKIFSVSISDASTATDLLR